MMFGCFKLFIESYNFMTYLLIFYKILLGFLLELHWLYISLCKINIFALLSLLISEYGLSLSTYVRNL